MTVTISLKLSEESLFPESLFPESLFPESLLLDWGGVIGVGSDTAITILTGNELCQLENGLFVSISSLNGVVNVIGFSLQSNDGVGAGNKKKNQ